MNDPLYANVREKCYKMQITYVVSHIDDTLSTSTFIFFNNTWERFHEIKAQAESCDTNQRIYRSTIFQINKSNAGRSRIVFANVSELLCSHNIRLEANRAFNNFVSTCLVNLFGLFFWWVAGAPSRLFANLPKFYKPFYTKHISLCVSYQENLTYPSKLLGKHIAFPS